MDIISYKKYMDENNDGGAGNGDFNNNIHVKTVNLTPKDLILLLFLIILFCAAGTTESPLSLLAVIVTAPLYAAFSYRIGNHFSFFVPLVAIGISLVVTRNMLSVTGVLLAAGMAYAILRAVNRVPERAKTSAVVGCVIAFIAFFFMRLFILTKIQEMFTIEKLTEAINAYFSFTKETIVNSYDSYSSSEYLGGIMPELPDKATFEKYVDSFIYQAKMMLPAFMIIWFMICGYISASLLSVFARLCGVKHMLSGKNYSVVLSGISVTMYFLASIGTFFATGAAQFGFRNITFIMAPGFILCGVKQIGVFFENKRVPRGVVFLIKAGAVLTSLVLADIGITVLIILGMFYTARNIHASNNN